MLCRQLIQDGGEVVNSMVRDYREDQIDPSATMMKIAELQDFDEARLIEGSKMMARGISLKKAAREVCSAHHPVLALSRSHHPLTVEAPARTAGAPPHGVVSRLVEPVLSIKGDAGLALDLGLF